MRRVFRVANAAVPPFCFALFSHHDVRRFDHGKSVVADFKAKIVDGFVGDGGMDGHPIADVDMDMTGRLSLFHGGDFAFDLVASADFHYLTSPLRKTGIIGQSTPAPSSGIMPTCVHAYDWRRIAGRYG
jgi:hypothetical protein